MPRPQVTIHKGWVTNRMVKVTALVRMWLQDTFGTQL